MRKIYLYTTVLFLLFLTTKGQTNAAVNCQELTSSIEQCSGIIKTESTSVFQIEVNSSFGFRLQGNSMPVEGAVFIVKQAKNFKHSVLIKNENGLYYYYEPTNDFQGSDSLEITIESSDGTHVYSNHTQKIIINVGV